MEEWKNGDAGVSHLFVAEHNVGASVVVLAALSPNLNPVSTVVVVSRLGVFTLALFVDSVVCVAVAWRRVRRCCSNEMTREIASFQVLNSVFRWEKTNGAYVLTVWRKNYSMLVEFKCGRHTGTPSLPP